FTSLEAMKPRAAGECQPPRLAYWGKSIHAYWSNGWEFGVTPCQVDCRAGDLKLPQQLGRHLEAEGIDQEVSHCVVCLGQRMYDLLIQRPLLLVALREEAYGGTDVCKVCRQCICPGPIATPQPIRDFQQLGKVWQLRIEELESLLFESAV